MMTSQIRYNTKTILAHLQLYIAFMEGDKLSVDDIKEITGLTKNIVDNIIKSIKEMVNDLRLACTFKRVKTRVITNKTAYYIYKYKFKDILDYSFTLDDNLEDEKKVRYSAVIVYLMLKKKQYVKCSNLSNYFPKFDKHTFSVLLSKMKDVIGEELYKDEIQSYVIEDID